MKNFEIRLVTNDRRLIAKLELPADSRQDAETQAHALVNEHRVQWELSPIPPTSEEVHVASCLTVK